MTSSSAIARTVEPLSTKRLLTTNFDFELRPPPSPLVTILESYPPGPSRVREFVIGFGPNLVHARSTAVFQAQPQLVFRGSRLIIPGGIGEHFVINDIRVGRDSQMVSADPIPASIFSEFTVSANLGLETATQGVMITLSVSNVTDEPRTFSASLLGISLDSGDTKITPRHWRIDCEYSWKKRKDGCDLCVWTTECHHLDCEASPGIAKVCKEYFDLHPEMKPKLKKPRKKRTIRKKISIPGASVAPHFPPGFLPPPFPAIVFPTIRGFDRHTRRP